MDTNNRIGVEYTMVLESFSIPLDDGALGFGVVVLEGSCADYVINECTLYGESLVANRDDQGQVQRDDLGDPLASARDCSVQLEQAACDEQLLQFCCLYPDMCGEDPPDNVCRSVETQLEGFCSDPETSKYCCD